MPRPSTEEEERALTWVRILEAAMKHHGRSKSYGMQKVIATDADLGTSAVSKWAKAQAKPESATIRRLASLYNVSATWLEGREIAPGFGEYGAPDELLDKAADITELVVTELLPDGSTQQFLHVMRRAHDLLLEGRSESDVKGTLFDEVVKKKRGEWLDKEE